MQSLNQLVARSIIDPEVVRSFSSGNIADVLAELEFSPELINQLTSLNAETWTEFAVLAYRTVKAAQPAKTRIDLPSPAEGLLRNDSAANNEQVA